MSTGIYIVANDRVGDRAAALLASIRRFDPGVPVVLIPFDDACEGVERRLARDFGVRPFPDRALLGEVDRLTQEHFVGERLRRPTLLRKLVCWFGPFDRFVYLDCDVVVFDRIIRAVEHLDGNDFVWCDYQHRRVPEFVLRSSIFECGVLDPSVRGELFNTGFLASRRGVFSEERLSELFAEAAAQREHFPFSRGVNDQPVLNYLVLRHVVRRSNLTTVPGWRANPHPIGIYEVRDDMTLFDLMVGERHWYLHWSGFGPRAGEPYWEVWQHYAALAARRRGRG